MLFVPCSCDCTAVLYVARCVCFVLGVHSTVIAVPAQQWWLCSCRYASQIVQLCDCLSLWNVSRRGASLVTAAVGAPSTAQGAAAAPPPHQLPVASHAARQRGAAAALNRKATAEPFPGCQVPCWAQAADVVVCEASAVLVSAVRPRGFGAMDLLASVVDWADGCRAVEHLCLCHLVVSLMA